EHVDLMRLADQDSTVGRGADDVAPGPTAGHGDRPERSQVDHHQVAPHVRLRAGVAAHKQEALEQASRLAEGDGVDRGVERQHTLGTAKVVEPDDAAAAGPGRAPEGAVGGEGEVPDADIAEVAEAERNRVENLDAVARRDEDLTRGGLDR